MCGAESRRKRIQDEKSDDEFTESLNDYKNILSIIIKNIINEVNKSLSKGKGICVDRLNEGRYINSSLMELRTNLNALLTYKNRDIIFYSPQVFSGCLNDYCPSRSNCFKANYSENNKLDITSSLIRYIFECLVGTGTYRVDEFGKINSTNMNESDKLLLKTKIFYDD